MALERWALRPRSQVVAASHRAIRGARCGRGSAHVFAASFLTRALAPQNRRNTPGRIELMKYNRYLRKLPVVGCSGHAADAHVLTRAPLFCFPQGGTPFTVR